MPENEPINKKKKRLYKVANGVCDSYLEREKITLKEEAYKNMFEGGGSAYYHPKEDYIGMPLLESFSRPQTLTTRLCFMRWLTQQVMNLGSIGRV